MADPITIAQTGIDPTTGSYLSSSARKAMFRSATVSSSVFGRGGALVAQPKSELATAQGVQLLESNQQTLGTITEQLNSLRDQISSLNTGINSIADLISRESAVENSRLLAEEEQQRRLAEREIRVGRENELEQKLQNALVAPVQRATNQTMGFLERIKSALMYLIGGWFTNQGLQLLDASKTDNKKKFEEIKSAIIKGLFYAGAGFLAINTGFNVFIGLASRVAGLILKLSTKILTAPFRAAGKLFSGMLPGQKPKGSPKTPVSTLPGAKVKPKPKGGPAGGLFTGMTAVKDALTGDPLGAALGAASFLPGLPGKAAKGLFWGKELLYDTGILGKMGSSNNQPAEQQSNVNPQQPASPPPKSSTPQTPAPSTPPASTPKSSMLPFSQAMNLDLTTVPGDISTPGPVKSTVSESRVKSPPKTTDNKLNFSSMPSQSFDGIGPPDKPSPEVVITSTSSKSSPPSPQKMSGFAGDVPSIPTSDGSNFHSMYAKLTYNVVE